MKRLKISCRLQKETEKAFVFTSGSPRMYKGQFMVDMFSLPKSQITVIEHKLTDHNEFDYMIVDIPDWLFNKLPINNKAFAPFISII